jgi:hypothetical protein
MRDADRWLRDTYPKARLSVIQTAYMEQWQLEEWA